MGGHIKIVFQNRYFFIVDKPPDWLSVPSDQGRSDRRPSVGPWIQELLAEQIWPIHRLDLEVSGLLMFARTREAHIAASWWFKSGAIEKTYEAWTEGARPQGRKGETRFQWESRITRGKTKAFASDRGKTSVTIARWEGEGTWNGRAILHWKLEPKTGRAHQLRFELSEHGWPIVGDKKYGSTASFPAGAIALRAIRISLERCPDRKRFGLPATISAPPLKSALKEWETGV